MVKSVVVHDEIYEGASVRTYAHLVGLNDVDIVETDLNATIGNAVWLQVYDIDSATPDTPLASYSENGNKPAGYLGPTTSNDDWSALLLLNDVDASNPASPAGVVFSSLQTGSGWDKDTTGFNFMHDYHFEDDSATKVALEGGHRIRLEYTLNATAGGVNHGLIFVIVNLKTRSLQGA